MIAELVIIQERTNDPERLFNCKLKIQIAEVKPISREAWGFHFCNLQSAI